MAGSEGFKEVLGLLSSLYSRCMGLPDFLQSVENGCLSLPLLQSGDALHYRRFISELVVCVPHGAKPLPQPVNFQQVSTQRELVARVIQKICEKKKRNILAFGYALIDEKSSLQIMFASNICNYSPNPTTATISNSALWELLLSRIGDDVMMYLLEYCSLFMVVPPSCCYQISGRPVYNFSNDRFASTLVKQQFLRCRCNVLLAYVQKKVHFHKKYLLKANRWKHRKSLQANSTCSSSHNRDEVPDSIYTSPQSEAQMPKYQLSPTINADLKFTGHADEETDPQTATWVRSGKRHYDGARSDFSVKRRKRNLRNSEELNLSHSVVNGKQIPENDYGALFEISVEKNCATNITDMKSVGKGNICQEILSEHHLQEAGSITGSFITQAQLLKGAVCLNDGGRDMTIKTRQTKDIYLPHRLHGRKSANSDSVLQNENAAFPIYIERGYMLYCSRSLKEDFSQSFLLNDLKGGCVGAQKLIETIFLNSSFEQKSEKKQLGNHWKKKKLPKRYWQMKHVFQEMIYNHKKCPYRVILTKNCPTRTLKINVNENIVQTGAISCKFQWLIQHEVKRGFKQEKERNGTEPSVDQMHNGDKRVSSHVGGDVCSHSVAKETCSMELNVSSAVSEVPKLDQAEKVRQINGFKDLDNLNLMLLEQHNNIQQVYAFVRECLHRVVPEELWGSSHNKCCFLKNVKKIISMGKYDRLSLREVMWKMRVNDCLWLRLVKGSHFVPVSEHQLRERILTKFLYWLMNAYVIQLLRSFFYITETMFQKNKLFFYRKSVWSKIQKIGLGNHFAKAKLRLMSAKEIEAIKRHKSVPLISTLRFIPKQNGLRPVVKMNAFVGVKTCKGESQDKKVQHFSTRLKNLFSVLNYKRMTHSYSLGSSVFGLDDIYKLWKQFVLKVRETNDEKSCFYFVKTDVTGAYDTIPIEKLEDVVSNIINPKEEERYCIRRYAAIWRDSNGDIRKSFKRHASTMSDFLPNMKQFLSYLQKSFSLQHTILVEQSLSLNEISSRLFAFFRQIIHNNILKISDQYYLQCCGIPQGSILSALLCSFCYGDMENKLFYAVQQDGVLLRLIDDFLLVTPHLMQAKTFLRTLAKGIPQYGCSISQHKTMVNFPIDEDLLGFIEAKQIPNCSLFPWCGLLLDTKTLEVYCDYSGYAGTSIRSSLTFNYGAAAGKSMREKLIAILKLKCHGIFLDLTMNKRQTVYTNIYKIFLLQAYRFHACVCQLPFNQSVNENPSFFLTVIADMSRCCYSILKAKNRGIVLDFKDVSGPFPFEAAQWLCFQAFIFKLTNHKTVYNCLLEPLKNCKFQLLKKVPKVTMQLLKTVTHPSLHKDFAVILD